MVWWKSHSTAECPQCSHPAEDKYLTVQCPAQSADLVWTQSMAQLQDYFKQGNTDKQLVEAILIRLWSWYNGSPPADQDTTPIFEEQSNIRWDHLLDGWMTRT